MSGSVAPHVEPSSGADVDRTVPRARIPRGVRSLSGRLVLVLSVPLLAAQVLAGITLYDRHHTAAQARALTEQIDIVAPIGLLLAPATLEHTASLGLAEVDRLGVDRDLVTTVTGIDHQAFIASARTSLDEAFEQLAVFSDVTLPSGERLGDALAAVRAELAGMRSEVDLRRAGLDRIEGSVGELAAFVSELMVFVDDIHAATPSAAPELGPLMDDLARLLRFVDALATEAQVTGSVIGVSDGSSDVVDVLLANGAADLVTAEYAESLSADDQVEWTPVAEVLEDYLELRPLVIEIATIRSEQVGPDAPNLFESDPRLIEQLARIVQASYVRLSTVGEYARLELADAIERADAIATEADQQARFWIGVIVSVTMASIGFLLLVVVGTARPLSRLTARAMLLGEGVIIPRPLPLTGPSDVRAVTATFNSVNRLLTSFESQLRRMSAGETVVPADTDDVPGTLGESLRAQVHHLSDMTKRLRDSEGLARAIVETAADAIWTVDRAGTILTANEAAEQLLGVTADSQRGVPLMRLLDRRHPIEQLEGEIELVRADGSVVDVLVSRSEVPAEPEPIHTVFARDISDRKRFEAQLAHQARHDPLTDLPNRLAALEHLEHAARRAERSRETLAVLFIDLDGFKSVNDSRGHAEGDHLLHEVGNRLARTLRHDEFVARLGGDEFLVVSESLDGSGAAALGERIIREIAQPYVNGDDLYTISASVGVALTDAEEAIDALELVREADVAVYHAKERGRSRVVVFDESLQEAVEATAEIELALRHAIRDGQLVLHFQPVVDLDDAHPWGAEALVRWERPGHGVLPPDRFVPVAERSSLVLELDRWVLTETCRTLARWQSDPSRRHLHLAVNVSGRHLLEGDLVGDLDDAVRRTGADPTGIELELTETHLLDDFERANVVLGALRARGVSIAVDDFGTGYSSMGYLRQLQIDTLKIDRLFVARVNDAGYDRTIVEVLVQLGLTLGLDLVAEGVETAEQLEFLRQRQCTRAQGFHVAVPMPAASLEHWLDARVGTRLDLPSAR